MGNLWRIVLAGVDEFADNFDRRLVAAFCRHFGSRHEINSLLLVEGPDHQLELRIREDPSDAEDAGSGSAGDPCSTRDHRVNGVGGDGLITGAQCANLVHWGAPGHGITKRIDRGICSLGTAAASVNTASDAEWPQQPAEAEFLQVILIDFQKLCLDVHLGGGHSHRGIHQRVNEINVIPGISDHQFASGGEVVGAGSRRKVHPLRSQVFLGIVAGRDPGSIRIRGRSSGLSLGGTVIRGFLGDERRGNLVFLGDKHVGRFRKGDDGDRIRVDLEL